MADVKKIATRDSYGNALAALGAEHEDLIVFDADLAGATKTGTFKKACPERFFDCGGLNRLLQRLLVILLVGLHYGKRRFIISTGFEPRQFRDICQMILVPIHDQVVNILSVEHAITLVVWLRNNGVVRADNSAVAVVAQYALRRIPASDLLGRPICQCPRKTSHNVLLIPSIF